MTCRMIQKYTSGGKAGLGAKKRYGNSFAVLHCSKNLPELEKQRLFAENQKIEMARLKMDIEWKDLAQTGITLLGKM